MLDYINGLVAKWHERSEYAIPLRRGCMLINCFV